MRLYTFSAGLLTVIILVAHAVAPASYSWTLYSVSHLGAQGYKYAYILRFGLISHGVLMIIAAILKFAKRPRTGWPHGFLGVYGFAILLTGFFSTSPFEMGVPFSTSEANLHARYASVTGIAIVAAMAAFAVIARTARGRIIHLAAFVLLLLIPEVFLKFSDAGGVLQRLTWLVAIAWFVVLESPSLQADFRQPTNLPPA